MMEASEVRLEQAMCWLLFIVSMCLLAEGGLYHLLYVILYRDNYPTVTRGMGVPEGLVGMFGISRSLPIECCTFFVMSGCDSQ